MKNNSEILISEGELLNSKFMAENVEKNDIAETNSEKLLKRYFKLYRIIIFVFLFVQMALALSIILSLAIGVLDFIGLLGSNERLDPPYWPATFVRIVVAACVFFAISLVRAKYKRQFSFVKLRASERELYNRIQKNIDIALGRIY